LGFTQPLDGSQRSSVQTLPSLQSSGAPPTHAPAEQASFVVHALPSLQIDPSALLGFEQKPLAGSHVPATWHWSLAKQTTGFAPVQTPVWQVSLCVQALPSLQEIPFDAAGFEQAPLAGSQVPAVWHWSLAMQVLFVPPLHRPA